MTPVARALAAWLLLAAPEAAERTVQVRILEQRHPRHVVLLGPAEHRLEVDGALLRDNGTPVEQPLGLPSAHWSVLLSKEEARHYQGSLSARATGGEVVLVLSLPLEMYVADVVAAETTPGTPAQALRAQAVVARSFLLAQGPRHEVADVCDLAHCQVLRGSGLSKEHLAAARAAAQATAGQVLRLSSGAIAETLFHAACGGHTADPEEVLGHAGTGAASVTDSGCPVRPWEALVPLVRFRAALTPVFSAASSTGVLPEKVDVESLELRLGQGGYVTQVMLSRGAVSARGDTVARALDRAMGWGAIRSGRFRFRQEGAVVRVSGEGLGHGLGLCQAGAASRAARGESYRAILQHYFPHAVLF